VNEKEETNELLPVEQEGGKFSIMRSPASSFLNPQAYMQAKYIANDMLKDNALPKGITTAGQAVMIMQAGAMMDMNWVEALRSIYIVNGALNIWGAAVPNRLKKHEYKFKFLEEDQTHCKARVWKEDEEGKVIPNEDYTEDFKYEDAVKSGYTKDSYNKEKVGWKEGINRIKKMRYNVLSLIISTYIPNVLGPVSGIVEVSQDYAETDNSGNKISRRDKLAKAQAILDEAKKKEEIENERADQVLSGTGVGSKNAREEAESSREVSSPQGQAILEPEESLSEKNDKIIEKLDQEKEIVDTEVAENNGVMTIKKVENKEEITGALGLEPEDMPSVPEKPKQTVVTGNDDDDELVAVNHLDMDKKVEEMKQADAKAVEANKNKGLLDDLIS